MTTTKSSGDGRGTLTIYCCGCRGDVAARLTNGAETYPRRADLAGLPFWRCDTCGNFVGCHHESSTPIKPLGVIPTPEIKSARQYIHRILDPIWKSGRMPRGKIYAAVAQRMGTAEYHTAEIRSVEEARRVFRIVKELDQQP